MGSTGQSILSRHFTKGTHCPNCQKQVGIWPIFLATFLAQFGWCCCPHCIACLEFENIGPVRRAYGIVSWCIVALVFAAAGISGFAYETSRTRLLYADSDILLVLSLFAIVAALIVLSLPLDWAFSWYLHRYREFACISRPTRRFIVLARLHKVLLRMPLSLRIFLTSQVLCAAVTALLIVVPICWEQTLIWRIEQAGGQVLGWRRLPDLRRWWAIGDRKAAGISTVSVFLSGLEVTDARLAQASATMQGIDNLSSLGIQNTQITDHGFRHVAELMHLRRLTIECWSSRKGNFIGVDPRQFQITDAGLTHLRGLANLESLTLKDTAVTDAGLARLAVMVNLRHIQLIGNGVTDAGLIGVGQLTGLEYLYLSDTQVTDAGLIHLRPLTKLKWLCLSGTQVTGTGLADLADMPTLGTVILDRAAVTDAGLEHVARLSNLTFLSLKQTHVTDVGLAHLKDLPRLMSLNLGSTPITDAGMEHIQGMTSLTFLNVERTAVTDAALQHLKGLEHLVSLAANDTDVSHEGLAELAKSLPRLRIPESGRNGK